MDQEKIMKRRMIRAIVLFIFTFIAMLVFIGLYIDETKRTQETYVAQYKDNLMHVSEDITSYLNNEGDLDMRYMRIVSDMSSANSFAFLVEDYEKEKVTINQLNACVIKYPEQTKQKLPELKTAIDDILANLDKGYKEADDFVSSIDKKGR